MKNLMLILALAMVLTSAFAFAEEEVAIATSTSIKDAATECFVDEDGDGVCDTCGNTAEECAAELEAGGCETCTRCGDSDKVEEDEKVK